MVLIMDKTARPPLAGHVVIEDSKRKHLAGPISGVHQFDASTRGPTFGWLFGKLARDALP